jgi:hypothetical protein
MVRPIDVHPIDRMGCFELTQDMVSFFGVRRATELFGWALIIGPLSLPSSVPELRAVLEARGFTKSSMYNALTDMRRYGVHVEERAGYTPQKTEPMDGVRLLRSLAVAMRSVP